MGGDNGEVGKIFKDENGNWCVLERLDSLESDRTGFTEADNPFQ
jgi:hypothetical protein